MASSDVTPGDNNRKRNEWAAREEDAIYRLVAENTDDLIRLHDLTGRCIYASPSVERLYGRVPTKLFDAVHPGDMGAGRRWWDRVLEGGKDCLHWRVRDAAGNWRWLETSPTLVRYHQRAHVMTVCRDITERKRGEEALAAREAEFRNLAESSPGMMGAYYRRPDGSACMPYASARIWDLYGLRPEDVVNDAEPLLGRTHPDDDARLRESIIESARKMTPWRLEYRVLHPTRGELWLEGHTNPSPHPDGGVIWYGFRQDISERKRIEEESRKQQEVLQKIFDNAPIAINFFGANGRLQLVNRAWERTFGWTVGELREQDRDIFIEATRDTSEQQRAREFVMAATGEWSDFDLRRRDGTQMIVSVAVVLLSDGTRIALSQDVTERRRAEEAAKAGEERLRLTFDAARIGTGEMDLRTNQISLSNALQRVVGLAPGTGNLTFAEWVELIHPEDRDRLRQAVEHAKAGRSEIAIDYRVLWPDASVHWTTSRAKVFCDATGRATRIVAALMDITELKRVEEEVRKQKEVLQKVFDNAPLAISFFDANGHLLLVNRAWERLFGWTLKELAELNLDVYAEILPDPRERQRALDFMARGRCEWEEFNVRTKDGAATDVSLSAVRLSDGTSIGLLQDITARLRADAALRHNEELLRRAEAMAHLASWTFNVADGTVLTSEQGSRLFGWASTPHRMDDLVELAHPDDRARVQAAFEAALGGVPFEMEHRIVVGSETKWVHRRVEPEADPQGHVVRLIGVSQDVTARRRLEEQFRQAQKMEAIGTLAGGVAHDFNNLLTIIIGYSDLLVGDLTPDDPMREPLVEIHTAGARARALTRQLLAFSRQQVLEPKVLDLNVVVADTEKMLRRLIGEDIVLTAVLDPGLAHVKADPGQLEQVLVNLAVNARDAMPRGGRLTIETRNVMLDASSGDRPSRVRPGEYVVLVVSDTGVGMDPPTKARVFEPFFTTKDPGSGTGLGLAVVHGVVTQSGGHIEVDSDVGQGTTFKIYLPAVEERLSTGKLVSGHRPPPRGSETILLVEDEAAVRELAGHILASCGYTVLEATNGQEAVQVAEGRAGPIDLLVSDVVMPHLGGRQLAERLTVVKPGLKVLFVSGYADDAVVRHGVREAGHAFLQKPFTPSGLARKVRDVLDQKQLTSVDEGEPGRK